MTINKCVNRNSMSRYRQYFVKRKQELTNQDLEFLKWMDQVEDLVQAKIGLNLLDINDMPYYVSFEDGVTMEEMAKQTINSFNVIIY